jgi:hypothetical protein
MTNTAVFMNLIEGYNAHAFTHAYVFGFIFEGTVWAVKAGSAIMPYILKLDKASRGAGYSLRFCPNRQQKALLLSKGAIALCSQDYLNTVCASNKYNRGENFEKLYTEYCGQVWEKDHIPYTEAGDIEVDGIAYQIKFEKATFTNEKSLARM